MRKTVSVIVILCALLVSRARAAEPDAGKGDTKYLAPADMLKIMETSKTHYQFNSFDALKDMDPAGIAETYWPLSKKELEFPWIDDDGNGHLTLTTFRFENGSLGILKKAETAYGKKRHDKAEKLYRRAIDASASCYFAYIGLGDCLFERGDYEEAARLYQKAIDLNPYDFRGFFFKAHALAKLQRFDEARTLFIESLVLKPRRDSLLKVARAYAGNMGVRVVDDPFLPRSLARQEGDQVVLYVPESLPWFTHAVCKAFWIGEPGHRKDLTGAGEKQWSTSEETECLGALVIGYEQALEDKTVRADPALDRLRSILDDGMLNPFTYYEIFSRLSGDAMLLLPAAERDRLRAYVAKYVLVPREAP